MQVVMVDSENPTRPKRSGSVVAILGIVIAVSLFIALKALHEPNPPFQQVSIIAESDEEFKARLAELSREESAVIFRAHTELVALTLFALIVLYFLFNRSGIPKWTKYLLIAAAAASVVACWLQW
jgi:hypothetical protein